jgi:hypothetical protein
MVVMHNTPSLDKTWSIDSCLLNTDKVWTEFLAKDTWRQMVIQGLFCSSDMTSIETALSEVKCLVSLWVFLITANFQASSGGKPIMSEGSFWDKWRWRNGPERWDPPLFQQMTCSVSQAYQALWLVSLSLSLWLCVKVGSLPLVTHSSTFFWLDLR